MKRYCYFFTIICHKTGQFLIKDRHKRFFRRFGTPKTLDTLMAQHWFGSSQAEWSIRCEHCGYWNVPALDQDLDLMIGPKVPKWTVNKERPGVICAGKSRVDGKQCGQPLHTHNGMWVHGLLIARSPLTRRNKKHWHNQYHFFGKRLTAS
jgi:phage terminase large subunit GpA-like protein